LQVNLSTYLRHHSSQDVVVEEDTSLRSINYCYPHDLKQSQIISPYNHTNLNAFRILFLGANIALESYTRYRHQDLLLKKGGIKP